MAERLMLQPRRWYGWQAIGSNGSPPAPFDASPIFIESVTPLKTGAGLLELTVIRAFAPLRAVRERLRLKVRLHTRDLLVGEVITPEGGGFLALSSLDLRWIQQHSPEIWRRYPPSPYAVYGDQPEPQFYLNVVLGGTSKEILAGASPSTAPCELPPMSLRVGRMPFERSYSGIDAWGLLRGFIPRDMDDRWLIYAEHEGDAGTLNFRRSWTSILIWQVPFRIVEGTVLTSEARVDLDPRRGFGTPALEEKRLDRCIAFHLLAKFDWSVAESFDDDVDRKTARTAWRRCDPDVQWKNLHEAQDA